MLWPFACFVWCAGWHAIQHGVAMWYPSMWLLATKVQLWGSWDSYRYIDGSISGTLNKPAFTWTFWAVGPHAFYFIFTFSISRSSNSSMHFTGRMRIGGTPRCSWLCNCLFPASTWCCTQSTCHAQTSTGSPNSDLHTCSPFQEVKVSIRCGEMLPQTKCKEKGEKEKQATTSSKDTAHQKKCPRKTTQGIEECTARRRAKIIWAT